MRHHQPRRYAALVVMAMMLGVAAVGEASASSQGRIGAVSVAATTIGVVIPPSLQVARPADSLVDLSAGTAQHPLCISGRGVSAYSLSVAGSGPGGGLALSDGRGGLPYNAIMHSDQIGAVPLHAGLKSRSVELPAASVCEQASLALQLVDKPQAPASRGHGGVLTLVVSPE